MEARVKAAKVLVQVIGKRQSLTAALLSEDDNKVESPALVQELCFGVLRWHDRLSAILTQLLRKPLRPRDLDVECLLKLGLYQLIYMRVPSHAAIHSTVEAAAGLGKGWAKSLINGVLRNFLRSQVALINEIDRTPTSRYSHPLWLLSRLQSAYPMDWQKICEAANQRPPMVLRLNRLRIDSKQYLTKLQAFGLEAEPHPKIASALILRKAVDVSRLPGFYDGLVSVQDAAAQLAAPLLDCHAGMRVLDACASPGGKSTHILESTDGDISLLALEIDRSRIDLLHQTFDRLGWQPKVRRADAADPKAWWDGKPFNRILLDVPCSATGIIRRHPDIKLLRKPQDIEILQDQQKRLLARLWPLLAKGGVLLYVTCSILPEENWQPISYMLAQYSDAKLISPGLDWVGSWRHGWQILPGEFNMDGFYYAKLLKI